MISSSNWRRTLEAICLPVAALVFSLIVFGIFCAAAGQNPFAVYGSIYKAAFGSWRSFQNTLIRASPLMLTSLCTALPARLGLVIIGNEGALVVGGLGAVAAGLTLGTSVPPVVVQMAMALAAIACGGIWIGAVERCGTTEQSMKPLVVCC
jgi:simple sugar transport system permease protein